MKEGDTIVIGFNKKKEEVTMKVLHEEEAADAALSEADEA
jgi:hypothetical protein